MDNVIKSMCVTINSPAGLSTKEGALGVSAKGKEKEEERGNEKQQENNAAEWIRYSWHDWS